MNITTPSRFTDTAEPGSVLLTVNRKLKSVDRLSLSIFILPHQNVD